MSATGQQGGRCGSESGLSLQVLPAHTSADAPASPATNHSRQPLSTKTTTSNPTRSLGRRASLLLLTVLFGLAVVAVGRLRGIAALAGTVVALLKFIVPAVLDGRNPVFVAVVGAAAIAFFVLDPANGFSPTTTVA